MRIELATSSLPRKCSTTELQRLVRKLPSFITFKSGRRGSNPRPTAWKAVALPTELLPHNAKCCCLRSVWVGKDGFEPPNSEEDRFTVCCRWPLGYLPFLLLFTCILEPAEGLEPPTYWLQISSSTNWATLAWLLNALKNSILLTNSINELFTP